MLHIFFNCRVYNSLKKQFKTCVDAGIPVVISPIWMPLGRAMWGSRGHYGVLQKGIAEGEEAIKEDLTNMKRRKLSVVTDGRIYKYESDKDAGLEWLEEVGDIINKANGILPNSWLELKALQIDLGYSGNNFEIAHYGVDPGLFVENDPEIFRGASGIDGPFVMQAGRIEPGKNQAMLCWALRNTNIKIVLIGSSKHWPAYAELCKKISGNKLTIIDHIPQKMLASAYSAAKVHCLVSWMDTCGLVSLEAASCGTPLVGSTFGHELEYLQKDAWLADPGDADSILMNIEKAWNAGRYNNKSVQLKKRVLSEYNWEQMADASEKIYKNVIGMT